MEMGYYYLHTNGELIWKKFEPDDDSPFVRKVWDMAHWGASPDLFLVFLKEALDLGASPARIKELYRKNHVQEFVPAEVHRAVMVRLGES